ncbi:MAG: hypothetical protein JW861_08285 [Bacteroidales bacterium]|nr:hypothetical protein [Bacteroidales bacterium]
MSKMFYSKIILFGEYGIIFDSMALTIPFTHFHGEMSFSNKSNRFKYTDVDFASGSNRMLSDYHRYLVREFGDGKYGLRLDVEKMKKELDRGLYFESSIPQGYGLGSSGALVAAVYDRYGNRRVRPTRTISPAATARLKYLFAAMESFFHGKSSGIDPLNAYIGYPLLIEAGGTIRTVAIPRKKLGADTTIFLINTGLPGKTQPMVSRFMERYQKDEAYQKLIREEYISLTNECITQLLEGETGKFFSLLGQLSAFQYEHFRPMIPEAFLDIWKQGIETGQFTVKLCGSGGGGFLLGFTRNFAEVQPLFETRNIDTVTVYKSCRRPEIR